MRTEKRIYVKPYTAVLNVQTEGVIAASGGEIIMPPETFKTLLTSSCTQGGSAANQLPQGECDVYTVNTNKGCDASAFWLKNGFTKGETVNICYLNKGDGYKYYVSRQIKN